MSRPLLTLLLLLAPAFVSATTVCPNTWRKDKISDCVYKTDFYTGSVEEYYVHAGGWLVKDNCKAKYGDDFNAALTAALGKMKGACGYNAQKGTDWVDLTWKMGIIVSCEQSPSGDTCASEEEYTISGQGSARFQRITVKNAAKCMGPDTTGLPGILFHETLHANKVYIIGQHNNPNSISQAEFIKDQVYGAEAVCFFGANAKTQKFVSYFQCYDLTDSTGKGCDKFSKTVSDFLPPGMNKNE